MSKIFPTKLMSQQKLNVVLSYSTIKQYKDASTHNNPAV